MQARVSTLSRNNSRSRKSACKPPVSESQLNKTLLSALKDLPDAGSYCVAYSGGVDSHVLLNLLVNAREQLHGNVLHAVYIDHQLQADSASWARHCEAVCDQLDVAFTCIKVDAAAKRGESPEAAARDARYQALKDWLPESAVLLTAQHQDDQAETLLLQLFRGAGSKGLAAMPAESKFGKGLLCRPLLDISRESILTYAREQQLDWIEDPSNTDTDFDRNFLRHVIMPKLQQRWPSISVTLGRAARHQAGQAELNTALAEIDLLRIEQGAGLSVNRLTRLSQARQRNILRYWVQRNRLQVPGDIILQRVLKEILDCQPDASPLVQWPGAEIRRYRDRLFVMAPLPGFSYGQIFEWQLSQPLHLKNPAGVLSAAVETGKGLHSRFQTQKIEIRFRRGGEVLKPASRGQTHALKKLLQEKGIPAWERARIPLLYAGDTLVAVPDICICEGYQAEAGQAGYFPHWSRLEAHL